MTYQQHVQLIKNAITQKNGMWADFGSGDGAFTLALRDLAEEKVTIYSIDFESSRLKRQRKTFESQFPNSNIYFIQADFTHNLDLPLLDGILMANSLHYIKDQIRFLQSIKKYLKRSGKLLLVEYNTDYANPWVPYPLSYNTFIDITTHAGFSHQKMIERIHSTWLNEIYAAEAKKLK